MHGQVNFIRHIGALFNREPIKFPLLRGQQMRDAGVRIGFIPQRARKQRRLILVAHDANGSLGIFDARRGAGAIAANQLEFESSGGFVVAEHFDHLRFLLVAQE